MYSHSKYLLYYAYYSVASSSALSPNAAAAAAEEPRPAVAAAYAFRNAAASAATLILRGLWRLMRCVPEREAHLRTSHKHNVQYESVDVI